MHQLFQDEGVLRKIGNLVVSATGLAFVILAAIGGGVWYVAHLTVRCSAAERSLLDSEAKLASLEDEVAPYRALANRSFTSDSGVPLAALLVQSLPPASPTDVTIRNRVRVPTPPSEWKELSDPLLGFGVPNKYTDLDLLGALTGSDVSGVGALLPATLAVARSASTRAWVYQDAEHSQGVPQARGYMQVSVLSADNAQELINAVAQDVGATALSGLRNPSDPDAHILTVASNRFGQLYAAIETSWLSSIPNRVRMALTDSVGEDSLTAIGFDPEFAALKLNGIMRPSGAGRRNPASEMLPSDLAGVLAYSLGGKRGFATHAALGDTDASREKAWLECMQALDEVVESHIGGGLRVLRGGLRSVAHLSPQTGLVLGRLAFYVNGLSRGGRVVIDVAHIEEEVAYIKTYTNIPRSTDVDNIGGYSLHDVFKKLFSGESFLDPEPADPVESGAPANSGTPVEEDGIVVVDEFVVVRTARDFVLVHMRLPQHLTPESAGAANTWFKGARIQKQQ